MKKGIDLIWTTIASIVAATLVLSAAMAMFFYVPWLYAQTHRYFEER